MTHTSTEQPEALRLADKYEIEGFLQDHRFAQEHWCRQAAAELLRKHARITELEAQLSAIGAGGVEPLRKQASTADVADERDAFEKWLRIKPCGAAHDFGWEAWKARASLAATPAAGELATLQAGLQAAAPNAPLYDPREVAFSAQPAAQGVDMVNCKSGNWLTVVYRDIQPGYEARAIVEHPKASALSWSHALHDRDTAIAAQAKKGDQA